VIIAHPETADQLRRRAGWSGIPAIKNNAIFALPPDVFSRPGPRLHQAVAALAYKLHRELFPQTP
jgi:iron complex transport system substrate-binding protein